MKLYRRKQEWLVTLVVSLLFAAGGIVFWIYHGQMDLPETILAYAPIGMVVLEVACVFFALLSISFLSDHSVKLTIDEEGIEDFRGRSEPRFIPWSAIESMELEIKTVNGALKKARVFLFVVGEDDEIEEMKLKVQGLSKGPKAVYRAMRKEWLQFHRRRGRVIAEEG